jgi:alkylated DNA repair protein (DNA oxidative demethylase)
MTWFGPDFPPRERHLPGWLDTAQQRRLVQAFRAWSTGPVPIRAASLPSGHRMSVRTVCMGWHWQPYLAPRTFCESGSHRRLGERLPGEVPRTEGIDQ